MTEPLIKERLLPKFSVHRPVTVTMILLAILVIGAISYFRIKIDLFPSGMNNPYLGVWVPYPDANPKEIEQQIVKPIEGQLKTVKNLERVYSNSSTNGNWFWLEFTQNANMDLAYAEVTDRLERCRPLIPDEIEHFYVRRFRENDEPVIYFGISISDQIKDPNYAIEKFIKQPIEGIKGVANIEMWGLRERFFQVVIKDDQVKSYGVDLSQIIRSLMNDNFSISNGYVYDGHKKFLLRTSMKFKNLEEIKQIPIGNGLKLNDIADVKFDFDDEQNSYWRINGKLASGIAIYKESSANTVETCNLIVDKISEQFRNREELNGAEFFIFWNQGKVIQESINNVQITGFWGGIFAFVVLFFFLRRIKMTIMLTLAIPLALLLTVITMYFLGWTLNLITLMGLMISVGMVIDNAIVITENIYRFNNMGYPLKKSAVLGASEVGLAITLATLTTIVVFLPMMLMSGNSQLSFFLLRIGLPVVFSLVGSLFIALVFIPLISTKLTNKTITHNKGIIFNIGKKYSSSLDWILKHRFDSTLIILIVIASLFYPMSKVKTSDSSEGGPTDARVRVRFPSYYSPEKADSTLSFISNKIMERDSIYHVENIVTNAHGFRGRIEIYLKDEQAKQWYDVIYRKIYSLFNKEKYNILDRTEFTEDLKKHLPIIPGVQIRTSWQDRGQSDKNQVTYNIRGYDTDKLADIADELDQQLRWIDGVLSVDTDIDNGNDEFHILINREKAFKANVSPRFVANYLTFNYRGRKLSNFKTADREIPIYIKSDPKSRVSLHRLKNTIIQRENVNEVDLSSIANYEIKKGIGNIRRENGRSFLALNVFVNSDNLVEIQKQIESTLKNYKFPKGYYYDEGSRLRRMEEQNNDLQFALLLSIVFVFIIMGVLFESFILPLSVLISIPAAFSGAYWFLYITDTTFEIMAGIGLVVLVGVVVNNAIVLIDMINQFRVSGLSRMEAIKEAAAHRFRPILMTALTTICGLLPMAIGNTSLIGIPYSPMGITMIGGLISSTFLTLFAVPLFYTYLDDLSFFSSKIINRFF